MSILYTISLGIALAAAGGIRPFFTLLCLAVAEMLGYYTIAPAYAIFTSQGVIFILVMLFGLETLGYLFKTRMLLNNLFFETLAMCAGFFIMLFTLEQSQGHYKWIIALFCGSTTSGIIQGIFLLAKDQGENQAQFSYNAYIAIIELILTVFIICLALLIPYVVSGLVVLILVLALRKVFFRQISRNIWL